MKITLIQTHLYWEDRVKNISHFDALLSSVKEQSDLIVLPEMFTTGFTMTPERFAEEANGPTLEWLRQKAGEKKAVITGSVAVKENNKFYNRLYWVAPDGNFEIYNKRHLFRMANEDAHYTAGSRKIITQINNWKICPMVCYDLRFPVWSRNRFKRGGKEPDGEGSWEYDALLYVANWPEARNYPWKQLLIARAIENQCYVIGLNRIGRDGNNHAHSGESMVINPRGEIISNTKANEESIETISLDKNYLDEFRKIFPVGLDADDFELK
jgi:omega-amidase